MLNFFLKGLFVLLLFVADFGFSQGAFPMNPNHEKRIKSILKTMTVEEKIGQTCQITLDAILKTDATGKTFDPPIIDEEKLKTAIAEYHVGSLLNVSSHTLTLSNWKEILEKIEQASKNHQIKAPIIYGIDAIHGVNYTVGGTLFPQEIGLAATWNRNLAYQFGRTTAYEIKATGLSWNFSPVLDLGRQPLWSRFFETFGEDPYLASELGKNLIVGYQGKTANDGYSVAACLKHFVGYSAPFSGRDRTPAWIPEKYMHELYLPAFKAAIDAGAMTLMINSGDVNGIPGHANYHLLTEVLKKDWGFKGFTVSDWEDFIMLNSVHSVSKNLEDAVVLAFNAGVDMSMVPNNPQYKEYIAAMKNAVATKRISIKRLNDAVARILRVKMAVGLFEEKSETNYPSFGSSEHKKLAYQSALESITMLKNTNNTLPLAKNTKVLIAGATADNLIYQNGAWTHTWQGVDSSFNTKGCLTILQAFEKELGKENCLYSKGVELQFKNGWEVSNFVDTTDFIEKAKQVETIILCVGEMPSTEKPGDIHSLHLTQEQVMLAKIAYRLQKKVVLVLVKGRPRIIHSIVDSAAAIVQCYLPGDYGAEALVDLLFGKENFSGKLPYTYPKYDGVFEFYDHPKSVDRSGKTNQFDAFDPEWEFGFGLSYTSFDYSNLKLSKNSMLKEDTLHVSVTIKNVGIREGKEVVQMFVSDSFSSMVPAGKKLRNFEKVSLQAGESKIINFAISKTDLEFYNPEKGWILESGNFEIEIGKEKTTFELK